MRDTGNLLVGLGGILGTVTLAHWQAVAAVFAGLGTGCYMFAMAWARIRQNIQARPCQDCPKVVHESRNRRAP
jgi:hypothetical protein